MTFDDAARASKALAELTAAWRSCASAFGALLLNAPMRVALYIGTLQAVRKQRRLVALKWPGFAGRSSSR